MGLYLLLWLQIRSGNSKGTVGGFNMVKSLQISYLWKTTLCSPNRSRTEISLQKMYRIDPTHGARLFHSVENVNI